MNIFSLRRSSVPKRSRRKRVFFLLLILVALIAGSTYFWLRWQRDERLLRLLPAQPEIAARWQGAEDADTRSFAAWWLTEVVADFAYDAEKSKALWTVLLAPAEQAAFGRFSATQTMPETWLVLLRLDQDKDHSSFLPLDQQVASDYRGHTIHFVSYFHLTAEQSATPLYVWQGTDGIFAVSPTQMMIEGAIDQFLSNNNPAFLSELPTPFFSRDFAAFSDIDLLPEADADSFQAILPLPAALQQPDLQRIILTLTSQKDRWQWQIFARYPSWWQRLWPRQSSKNDGPVLSNLNFFYSYNSTDFSDRFPNRSFWAVLSHYGVPGSVMGKTFSDQLSFLYVGPVGQAAESERVATLARDFLARRYPEKQARALPDGIISYDLVPSTQVQQESGPDSLQSFVKLSVAAANEQLWVGSADDRMIISDSEQFLREFLANGQAAQQLVPADQPCAQVPDRPLLLADAVVWPDMASFWSKSHFLAWEQGEQLVQGCIY